MVTNSALYRIAKQFVYSTGLEDLNIFSKQYLNSIIMPYHSHNTENDNYASISIDFNNLHTLNTMYNYKTGDKVIHTTLSLIQSVLPKNSICCRAGGDEFIYLIDQCNPENIESIITKIHTILKEHEAEILFCSVTAYGIHSTEKSSLSQMLDEADLKITNQKNNSDLNSSFSTWGILEKNLKQNVHSFFKSLRFHNYHIDDNLMKILYSHAITSCASLLENNFSKSIPQYSENEMSSSIPMDDLSRLYNLFINDSISSEEINSISSNSYQFLIDSLTRDPITSNLSKDYFLKYLLNTCKHQYKVKYISTAFVKLYNTVFSHNTTDRKIKESIKNFSAYLKDSQNIILTNTKFSRQPGNYLISLGAGDYLLALPMDTEIDNESINAYINSNTPDNLSLENIMKFTCSKDFHTIDENNYEELSKDLCNECKQSKNLYKNSIITEPIISEGLSNIIYSSAEYYLDNIPYSNNIKQKSKFLNILSKVMLDISVDINKQQQEER